jgi:putative Holliday junction resolvase
VSALAADPGHGRILALDHGNVRTGVAVTDELRTIARPHGVVEKASSSEGMATIHGLVGEFKAELVIVGLPLSLDGTEGIQAQRARSFAARLRRVVAPVPVELMDERFTSKLADQTTRDGSQTQRDALAACHLLQSYLEGQQG